jgi:transcription elongation GreA/GreB family factor
VIALHSVVTWRELPLDRRFTRRIVTDEAFLRAVAVSVRDAHDQLMPETAPIARAVMGHMPGDVVTVETGFGPKTITVEGVRHA